MSYNSGRMYSDNAGIFNLTKSNIVLNKDDFDVVFLVDCREIYENDNYELIS